MGNALLATVGSPGNPQTVTLPLFDPRLVRENRRRFRRDEVPELAWANSFYCPSGRWPCRGWVLLRRSDYDRVTDRYRTDFRLALANQLDATVALPLRQAVPATLTLKGLALVQARCVTRGRKADPDAVYLAELTDAQGVLSNPWGQWPTASQYNVLAPAYPGQYYQGTTNGGPPWTWDQMVGDLWNQMPLLGAYPGLPAPPVGTPEGFAFPGEGCWDALNHVLDHLGLSVSLDLTRDAPHGIVQPGADDPNFTKQTSDFAPLLEDDWEYIDAGAGRAAGQVTVYFHRANQYYGTEETVRNDGLQWQTTPLYAVTVAAPAPYAGAPGRSYLWSDFAVRYDVDNNPLPADVAQAQAVAQDEVNAYYNRVTRGTAGFLRRLYAGALPFAAGSQVDGVRWYQTDGRAAWRTELVRGPQPPWPAVSLRRAGGD